MAPDANKKNRMVGSLLDSDPSSFASPALAKTRTELTESSYSSSSTYSSTDSSTKVSDEEPSLECVLQPRVLKDFSYVEQPVRCALRCQGTQKHLACNGKSAVFLQDSTTATGSSSSSINDEFQLLPQGDGSLLVRNTKTNQFLCCSDQGVVYASETVCDGMEKWIVTQSQDKEGSSSSTATSTSVVLTSVVSQRLLASSGKSVYAARPEDAYSSVPKRFISWSLEFTSGELCFLSLPLMDKRVRCNLIGELSLSKNYQGWEAWRFSEIGGPQQNHVRISPWAHSELLLAANEEGVVTCDTKEEIAQQRSTLTTTWTVERAPNGLYGVLIKAVFPNTTTRVLRYDRHQGCFCTIPDTALLLDESCVWDLESLHRQTYYLVTADNTRRLEGAKRGLTTRAYPGRLSTEEWKIEPMSPSSRKGQQGVVRIYSNARQAYLVSNRFGQVSLGRSIPTRDGSDHWILEERQDGVVLRAYKSQRVLVSPDDGPVTTVAQGTVVKGNTRWRLDPKTPRQVSKEKLQAVGGAVAVGILGTVATPLLISGAIGAIGIGSIGVAGEVTIGSIRAVEALSTVTRVTLSSSQLMISDSSSSFLSSSAGESTSKLCGGDKTHGGKAKKNRPFCSWRSW